MGASVLFTIDTTHTYIKDDITYYLASFNGRTVYIKQQDWDTSRQATLVFKLQSPVKVVLNGHQ